MLASRQFRVRVLAALERRAKAFRTRGDLYPCRIPREPVPLSDVIEEAIPDAHHRFDPFSLRSRTLLHLAWQDGSVWEVWVIMLPSGLKLFCASGEEEPHVLASGGRHASAATDRQFLELLSESAGQHFGIEMSGGAPAKVRTSITDEEFLTDVFVNLFEVTGNEASVREHLVRARHTPGRKDDEADGSDFRSDVQEWLALALR